MKKIMKIWSLVALFIAISIGMVNVAYGASGTLTGPEVVRRGKVRRARLNYLRTRVGKAAKVKELVK